MNLSKKKYTIPQIKQLSVIEAAEKINIVINKNNIKNKQFKLLVHKK